MVPSCKTQFLTLSIISHLPSLNQDNHPQTQPSATFYKKSLPLRSTRVRFRFFCVVFVLFNLQFSVCLSFVVRCNVLLLNYDYSLHNSLLIAVMCLRVNVNTSMFIYIRFDRHVQDIIGILLKMTLNTIILTLAYNLSSLNIYMQYWINSYVLNKCSYSINCYYFHFN